MKVSIITPVKNGSNHIAKCIESVIKQDYHDIEHIIIDGESEDSTMGIIKSYGDKIAYYDSKKDKNMYAAINSGLSVSTGDVVACLNSDDYYYDHKVISTVVKNILAGHNAVYGNIVKYDADKKTYRDVKLPQSSYKSLLLSRHSTFLPQPTLFMKKELYDDYGPFDDYYYFSSDYDLILKVLRHNEIKHIDSFFTVFRQHAGSITMSQTVKMIEEKKQIININRYEDYSLVNRAFHYLKDWIYYKYINAIAN